MKNMILYIDGKQIGVIPGEITITRNEPEAVRRAPVDPSKFCSVTLTVEGVDLSPLLSLFGLGPTEPTLQGRTAWQCVRLAERIAFGAWAIRCAEGLVR